MQFVFAGCSSSRQVQINYFNGNCNTNCGGVVQGVVFVC